MKVVQAVIIFPALVFVKNTLFVDENDNSHLMRYAVIVFVIVGLIQVAFFLKASHDGDL